MRLALAIAVVCSTLLGILPGHADKRVALVIGNDRYPNLPATEQLRKAVNDARAVGDELEKLGFEVIRGENLGRQALDDKLDEFTRRLVPGDTAFFFFSGHGVAINGGNYILPSDAPNVDAGQELRLARAAFGENDIIQELQHKNVKIAVVVLDACRNNPFRRPGTRGVGNERGFVRSDPVSGVFSLYSAGVGQTALDRLNDADTNPNSVFTRALLPRLSKPGLDLGALAVQVREEVWRLAQTVRHDQRPAYYDETIGGAVYLAGLPPLSPTGATAGTGIVDPAAQAWAAVRDATSIAMLERFVALHGTSLYAPFATARIEELKKLQTPTPPSQPTLPVSPVPTPSQQTAVAAPPLVPQLPKPCGMVTAVSSTGDCGAPTGNAARAVTSVTDAMLRSPPASDWLMWRRTYDGHGYSPLDHVNKDNVGRLQPAWMSPISSGPIEATPIVHDGILYLLSYADKVQALTAATGDLVWEYKRDLPEKVVAEGGSSLTKRNMAIYEDKLFVATSDAHVIALEAKTGKLVWDHTTADWTKGWRYTAGPFVVNGKVIQGMGGCGNGQSGGCFITGHDAKTGAELWRVNTIAHSGDPNFDTWNGLPLEVRFGVSGWNSGSYDPETNLVFYGTGSPYPWIAEMRGTLPGRPGLRSTALYSGSTLAINPDTGRLTWYYQHLQNDTWNLDYAHERQLVDFPVNGVMRKAVVTTGKLGIIEALDRTNGQWLWHKETVPQNVVAAIDPRTGEKTINVAAIPHVGRTTVNCPADPGGRGAATAYSPKTGTLYLPLNEFCANTTPTPLDPGRAYTGGGRAVFSLAPVPNSDGKIGRIDAVKLADRSTVWSYRQRAPTTSAVLPTGGGVVFAGSLDGWFRAFDDATGNVLWETRLNNVIDAFPISYSASGKQYVAVAVGSRSSQSKALAALTPELRNPDGGSVLWVFALPDK